MQVAEILIALICIAVVMAPASAKEPTAIRAVAERMREFIAKKEIAGAVTLVATPDRVVHLDCAGMADVAGNRPMKPDTIFWIASMTKPITGTAIMMLQDEGKLSIDDPVSKYIPELGKLKTPSDKPANLTVRHLLTHTSGMGEMTDDEARSCKTLAETIPIYTTKPMQFEPGTEWRYCQSGINAAGRIIEVVSGMSLPEFFESRIFRPLGMKDTTFYLSESQHHRLAQSYRRTAEGRLEETSNFILLGKQPTNRDRFPAANGGLFSTASDYARFCQMILNHGTLNGHRYLKQETVELMTSIQTGELHTGFTEGNGWGIGWCVVRQPQGVTAMLSPGTCGHGGAYGTQAWIDPVKRRAYILMVQRADFPNSDASDVRRDFQRAAADALNR